MDMKYGVKVAYNKVVNHCLIWQIVAYYMVCYANVLGPVYGVLVLGLMVIYVGNDMQFLHIASTIPRGRHPPWFTLCLAWVVVTLCCSTFGENIRVVGFPLRFPQHV